ncbi:MAG: hypothetical protein CMJ19_05450 [Phycisphaeraceae bacterium]|nr:hypothetical protein [Phycisphaeraceae bacterium]
MQVHWHVKPAEAHDRDELIQLWKQFMCEEHEQDMALAQTPADDTTDQWATRLEGQIQQGKVTVIGNDEQLVGFIGMIDSDDASWVPTSVAYIVDIYMLPHARSFLAFKQLIEGFTQQVKPRYTQVWTNIAAQKHRVGALLSRLGFTVLQDFEAPGMKDQCYLCKTIRENDSRAGVPAALAGFFDSIPEPCPMMQE